MTFLPSSDFLLEVAKGNVVGHSLVHKFGRNPDIDTASGFEAIWNEGGDYSGFNATSAETVEIFSSDANDTSAGTGARTIEVFGLNSSYVLQQETVTLNGVTAVDTTNTYIRLHRGIIRSAGSVGSNVGDVTIRQKTTPANVFASVPIGYAQTMVAAYTIPAGKTGFLYNWDVTLDGKTTATVNARLCIRVFGEVFAVKEERVVTGNPRPYVLPKSSLPEKSDITLRADTTSNNTGVSGTFDLLLVDDS